MRTDKPHIWHMEMIAKLCAADPEILIAMPFRVVLICKTSRVPQMR
jgi:protein phosphatase